MKQNKKYVVYVSKESKEIVEKLSRKSNMSQGEWMDKMIQNKGKLKTMDGSLSKQLNEEIAKEKYYSRLEELVQKMDKNFEKRLVDGTKKWWLFWK